MNSNFSNLYVSILVLMEVGLREKSQTAPHKTLSVSILVLMEVGLRVYYHSQINRLLKSFNPCFNGSWSESLSSANSTDAGVCFNPCFNGSWSERLFLISFH